MTIGTLNAAGPFRKLPIVIVLVAIGAFREGKLFFEISFYVAGLAFHRGVLAFQRIFGLGVIEGVVESAGGDSFPTTSVMAGLATLVLEASFVRIRVAVVALAEGQSPITRRALRIRSVALFAFHLLMQAG